MLLQLWGRSGNLEREQSTGPQLHLTRFPGNSEAPDLWGHSQSWKNIPEGKRSVTKWQITLVNVIFFCEHIWKCTEMKSIKRSLRASLVAQWLRVSLPMKGTLVRALIQEDPTCRGATKPVRHNYWACALEPVCHNYWSPHTGSPCSTTRKATAMRRLQTATRTQHSQK